MAEHIAQAITELVPELGNALVGSARGGIPVAAIFDQRYLGVRRAQNVVVSLIHGAVEAV
jgi:hypothetical protein